MGGVPDPVVTPELDRLSLPINLLDAAGLSLFAVTGASKAQDFGLGAGQAIILGAVTGVGGGTVRDVLIGRIPAVLHIGLYAIPALIGAAVTSPRAGWTCTAWPPRPWPERVTALLRDRWSGPAAVLLTRDPHVPATITHSRGPGIRLAVGGSRLRRPGLLSLIDSCGGSEVRKWVSRLGTDELADAESFTPATRVPWSAPAKATKGQSCPNNQPTALLGQKKRSSREAATRGMAT